MSNVDVKIFFDESGKRESRPTTMGGLLIPSSIYESQLFQEYNKRLKDKKFIIHWTDYTGKEEHTKIIVDIIEVLMKFSTMFDFNVINYLKPTDISKEKFEEMIYTKLPERIFYGLLRFHGYDSNINAKLFIEEATEYRKVELDKIIEKQLNIQAIYRGQHFKINGCEYKTKNQEIGIELTDLILGVIRTIIINSDISKTKKLKNHLVVELLKIKEFHNFLANIKYFEWASSYELTKLDFNQYIKLFLSNQQEWFNYITP